MLIEIRVRANAKQNKVGGEIAGRLIVFVQAPAIDGKANEAVAKVLAEHFQARVRDIKIIRGETNRDKTVEVAGAGIEPAT
ncbi:MAG: DUF167 domain-containing protein [Candidatus Nanopelagicaceae bacterium]